MDEADKTCIVYSSEAQLTQEKLLEQFELFEKANSNVCADEIANVSDTQAVSDNGKPTQSDPPSRETSPNDGTCPPPVRTVWKIERDNSKVRRNSDTKQLSPKKNSQTPNVASNFERDSVTQTTSAQQSRSYSNTGTSMTKYTKPVSDLLITGIDDNSLDGDDAMLVGYTDVSSQDQDANHNSSFLEDEDVLSIHSKEESKGASASADWMNVAMDEDNICGFETSIDSVLSLDVPKDLDIPLSMNTKSKQESDTKITTESNDSASASETVVNNFSGVNDIKSTQYQTGVEIDKAKRTETDNDEDSSENEIVEISINYDSSGSPTITKYGKGQVSLDSSGSYDEMEASDSQSGSIKDSETKDKAKATGDETDNTFTEHYIKEQIQEANKAIDEFLICKDRFPKPQKSIDGALSPLKDVDNNKGTKRSGSEVEELDKKRFKKGPYYTGDIYGNSFPLPMRDHDLTPPIAIVSPLGYPDTTKLLETPLSKSLDSKYPNTLQELLSTKECKNIPAKNKHSKSKHDYFPNVAFNVVKDKFQTSDGNNWSFDGISADRYLFGADDILKNVSVTSSFDNIESPKINNNLIKRKLSEPGADNNSKSSVHVSANKTEHSESLARRSVLEQLLEAHGTDSFKTKQAFSVTEKEKESLYGDKLKNVESNALSTSTSNHQSHTDVLKEVAALSSSRRHSLENKQLSNPKESMSEFRKELGGGKHDPALAEQTKAKCVMHHRSSSEFEPPKPADHSRPSSGSNQMKLPLAPASASNVHNIVSQTLHGKNSLHHTPSFTFENRTSAGLMHGRVSSSQSIPSQFSPAVAYSGTDLNSSDPTLSPSLLPVAVARNMSLEGLAKYITENPNLEKNKSIHRQILMERMSSSRTPMSVLQGSQVEAAQSRPSWSQTQVQLATHPSVPPRPMTQRNVRHLLTQKIPWQQQASNRMPADPVQQQSYMDTIPANRLGHYHDRPLDNRTDLNLYQSAYHSQRPLPNVPSSIAMNESSLNTYGASNVMTMHMQPGLGIGNRTAPQYYDRTKYGYHEDNVVPNISLDEFYSRNPQLPTRAIPQPNTEHSLRRVPGFHHHINPSMQRAPFMMNQAPQSNFNPNQNIQRNENYIIPGSHRGPPPRPNHPVQQHARFQLNQPLNQPLNQTTHSVNPLLHSLRIDNPRGLRQPIKPENVPGSPAHDGRFFQSRTSHFSAEAAPPFAGSDLVNTRQQVLPDVSSPTLPVRDIVGNASNTSQPFEAVSGVEFGVPGAGTAGNGSEVTFPPAVPENGSGPVLLDMPYL